jgi:hypothetical protein
MFGALFPFSYRRSKRNWLLATIDRDVASENAGIEAETPDQHAGVV